MSLRSFETGNLSADNFKKILGLDGSTLEPAVRSGGTGQLMPCFDSCQLITTLMCNQFSLGLPKRESKHWFSCGAVGRSAVGVRSRDYQIFWDGQIYLAMGLRPHVREAHAQSSANKIQRNSNVSTILISILSLRLTGLLHCKLELYQFQL